MPDLDVCYGIGRTKIRQRPSLITNDSLPVTGILSFSAATMLIIGKSGTGCYV